MKIEQRSNHRLGRKHDMYIITTLTAASDYSLIHTSICCKSTSTMFNTRLFVLLIPLVGTAASMLIRVDDVASTKRFYVSPSGPVYQQKSLDGAQTSLGESIASGVQKIVHGFDAILPIRSIFKGRPGLKVADGPSEDENDRIDNVAAQVESVANELHGLETMAGIYFIGRLISGLLFSSIV